MAGSLNKVTLIGNLGKDPEVRTMQNGKQMATFSIATSESWKDQNSGEKREKTEWHNVVIFNDGLVRVVGQYLKKGSKIYVEGQLQTRKWQDQNGGDRYSTEVVLQGFNSSLIMLDTPRNGNNNAGGGYDQGYDSSFGAGNNNASFGGQPQQNQQFARSTAGTAAMIDDDIPF